MRLTNEEVEALRDFCSLELDGLGDEISSCGKREADDHEAIASLGTRVLGIAEVLRMADGCDLEPTAGVVSSLQRAVEALEGLIHDAHGRGKLFEQDQRHLGLCRGLLARCEAGVPA